MTQQTQHRPPQKRLKEYQKKRWVRALLIALFWGFSLGFPGTGVAAPPTVVVSIKPIHALIAGVMAGIGKPDVLIKGGASPHATALRPSDARRLHRAELVFWIGKDLETLLIKPIAALSAKAEVIALSTIPGIRLRPARTGGVWSDIVETTPHPKKHDGDDDHEHLHAKNDMHIWLSTLNAQAIVRHAAKILSRHDPANGSRYHENAKRVMAQLQSLHQELIKALLPVRQRPYVVFHDSYQYFEREFTLQPLGSLSTHEARKPGAKRLRDLRNIMLAQKTHQNFYCVFAEPQFQPALINTLIDGTTAKAGVLDPLGARLKPSPELYFTLMRNLARDIKHCLASTS